MASAATVRQWGIALGYPLAGSGALPRALIERWNREHPADPMPLPKHNTFMPGHGYSFYGRRGGAARARSLRELNANDAADLPDGM